MPDFGIGELIAGFLPELFGAGEAAAGAGAGLETGLASIGAGAGGAAAGAGGGLADLVGTGAGLFGGSAGLEGTALAGGAGADLGALLGGGGATALGTAESFLGAPAASAFNPTAVGGASAFSEALPAGATPTAGTGTPGAPSGSAAPPSVFNTGTTAVPGVNAAGTPSAIPAGGGASAIAAPSGVAAPLDATGAIPTAGAGAAAPAAAPSSLDSLLNKAGGGVMDSLTKNPLGIALGAAGLGYNILNGQKQTANQKALSADAATATANSDKLVASGEDLQKYLTSGTLPPAYQQQVDQAISDARATAISNAAGQGLSTDPTQNTALATTLARIDASRSDMQAKVAQTLFSSGSGLVAAGQNAAGLSGQLYQTLVNNDTVAARNTGQAIASLAAALNNKTSTKVGSTNIELSQAA